MSLTWSPLPLSPISSVLHCDLRDLPLKSCAVVAVQFKRPSQYWYGPLICQLNGNEDVPQRSCLILHKSGKGIHTQFMCGQSCTRTKCFVKHQIYVKRKNLSKREIIFLLTKQVNYMSNNTFILYDYILRRPADSQYVCFATVIRMPAAAVPF